jgi:hypothetical protein
MLGRPYPADWSTTPNLIPACAQYDLAIQINDASMVRVMMHLIARVCS